MEGHGLRVWISLAIAWITLTFLGRVCFNDYVNYDDPDYVTANTHVVSGLSRETVRWAWTTFHAHNWHPLTWLSLALDCQLFGSKPWGGHLTNLLLHTSNAVLLFWALNRMTGALWPSAVVATLFALHPLHVESVAWISERKDVLSTFFFMLGLWLYAGYAQRPGWLRYSFILAVLALGLMAKPMLVTFPFVLLLLDYWPLRRWSFERPWDIDQGNSRRFAQASFSHLVLEKVPLLSLAVVSGVITLLAQGQAVIEWDYLPFSARVANALVAYVQYLGMAMWPAGLAVFYPHPLDGFTAGKVIVCGLVIVLISAGVCAQARSRPYLIVGWLWYLGTLVPVIGLVQVGNQALADRFTYVPLIGLCLMIAWGMADVVQRWPRLKPALVGFSGAWIGALAICSWNQAGYWHDSLALWEHTIAVTRANPVAHNNLGVALWMGQRSKEALSHFAEAYRLQPNYGNAKHNLEVAHMELGTQMRQQGQWQEAERHFLEAMLLDPGNAFTFDQRGFVLGILKQWGESSECFKQAVNLEPHNAQYRGDLALSFREQGHFEAADLQYREVLRLDPQWPKTTRRMAWTMATHPDSERRDGEKAIQLARQLNQSAPQARPENLDVLAAAYAEAGRFSEAIETAQAAMKLAVSMNRPCHAKALAMRCTKYERRQPWREPPNEIPSSWMKQ